MIEINTDLPSAVNVISTNPLLENAALCFLGMMKSGPFDIDSETAQKMLNAPLNLNGRPNSDVVKRRLAGQDVTTRPANTWIIDFGGDTSEEEAALYKLPFDYILTHVKPIREENRRARTRERWWIFGESRPGLRKAIKNFTRCIVTPEVAKHRILAVRRSIRRRGIDGWGLSWVCYNAICNVIGVSGE